MPLLRSIGKIVGKVAPYAVGGLVGGLIWKKKAAIIKTVGKSAAWVAARVKELKSKGYTTEQAEKVAAQEAAPVAAAAPFPVLTVVLVGAGLLVLGLVLFLAFRR